MQKFYSLILSLIVSSLALGQATNTFNPTSGSFNTATNWSLGHTPLATENVEIGKGKTATLNSNFTIATLNLKVGGTLDLERSVLSTTNGNIQIQGGGGKIIGKRTGGNLATLNYNGTNVFTTPQLNGPLYMNPSTNGVWVQGTLASSVKDFSVTVVNNSVRVQFAGVANTSFSLERSGDSKSWNSIANFSETLENRFAYNDAAPVAGINYYRLKSLSTDGSVNYSSIKVVHVGQAKTSLKVFPNPAVRSLNVYVNPGSEQRKINAVLVNRTGQVVAQRVLGASSGMLEFQVSNLPEGTYTLNLKGENGYAESRSVVISRK